MKMCVWLSIKSPWWVIEYKQNAKEKTQVILRLPLFRRTVQIVLEIRLSFQPWAVSVIVCVCSGYTKSARALTDTGSTGMAICIISERQRGSLACVGCGRVGVSQHQLVELCSSSQDNHQAAECNQMLLQTSKLQQIWKYFQMFISALSSYVSLWLAQKFSTIDWQKTWPLHLRCTFNWCNWSLLVLKVNQHVNEECQRGRPVD